MNDPTLIDYLEELAERFGIQIRYEVIEQDEDQTNVMGGVAPLLKRNGLPSFGGQKLDL